MPEVHEERILVAQACSGDKPAFEALTAQHRNAIYSLAVRMLGDREQALDASQDIFLRAYTKLRGFDQTRPFRPWLFAIASRTCIDLLRRGGGYTAVAEDRAIEALPDGEPLPAEIVEREGLQRAVTAALQRLGHAERVVVILKHLQGFTYEEISQITHLPLGTVKSHGHRGRRKLARGLQQAHWGEYYELPAGSIQD